MVKKVYEVVALLEANGWKYSGTRGDHHKFKKDGARRPIIVPGKRNKDLAPGIMNAILRETGLEIK